MQCAAVRRLVLVYYFVNNIVISPLYNHKDVLLPTRSQLPWSTLLSLVLDKDLVARFQHRGNYALLPVLLRILLYFVAILLGNLVSLSHSLLPLVDKLLILLADMIVFLRQ